MPTYKGNKGNLLQHWVLCELVSAAREHVSRLQFIDAHAMAPMAEEPKHENRVFDSVRAHLPGTGSSYECVWKGLVPHGETGYPNSASFVNRLWNGSVSMLLCEKDERTIAELQRWARAIPNVDVKIAPGDWRCRFIDGLRVSGELADLTFVSFDPYVISRHCGVQRPCRGNMYPEDLYLAVQAMKEIQTPVMIQLSTYSAQNNSQPDVEQCIRDRFVNKGGGIEQVAAVTADSDMMSVVLARGVEWTGELKSLNKRFQNWLNIARLRSPTSA